MKISRLIAPSMFALTMSLAACNNVSNPNETNTPALGAYGIATENMDLTIKPGDNFFKYVNGTWLANTEIPADKSTYGGFSVLADRSEERVRKIIEEASAVKAKVGTDEQKIGDFFAAFMDVEAIEEAGLSPVLADLETIKSTTDHEGIFRLMSDPSLGLSSVVSPFVGVDLKDVDNYIVYLTQSGLGMPNRDYYLDEDTKSQEIRAAYKKYLTSLIEVISQENVSNRVNALIEFETKIARHHWTPTERRDRTKTYNKRSLQELKNAAPGLPWDAMLDQAGLEGQVSFVVRETDAIEGTAEVFQETDLNILQDYLLVNYLGGKSSYLPKSIDEASFEFYGKALRGTEVQRERWKRGVSQIDSFMGEMVGKVYVEKHFPQKSKDEMDKLIENLRAAFKDGIDNLEWMDDKTKVEAQDKLAKFNPKIGYPDEWTDYTDLSVDRSDLIGTVKSAYKWSWINEIKKLGGPIDRNEWGMNPQTVNAYYRPDLNEIVFPAGILQAPFFDAAADPAVNYGGIGAVIGHEMGHGFDDQGRKTDGDGQQRDWWTEKDGEAFEARSMALVSQYNSFEPLPGEFVNGQFTLGENIGDLTGLTMGYAAYKKSLNGEEAPIIDGMTGDQRFFLSYGQIWQRKFRDEALRNRLKSDPHSPGEYRANGIVRNFDKWYEAFNVQPGDALYLAPEERVKIW